MYMAHYFLITDLHYHLIFKEVTLYEMTDLTSKPHFCHAYHGVLKLEGHFMFAISHSSHI